MMTIRTYDELTKYKTYIEKFNYLKLSGKVAELTFGLERYLNQMFYKSKQWSTIRHQVIVRDSGCDLGLEGYEISGTIYIHHMNPISIDDIEQNKSNLYDPDGLICVSLRTHNAIHYGHEAALVTPTIIERFANDTCPWKGG